MKQAWPKVRLGEVLRPVERLAAPEIGTIYRQLGVRLWGQGAYERETIDGGATRYAALNCVAENDVVVNKIWARNGSIAVVSAALDGCWVSSEFPLFACDRVRLLPRWIHWLTKTRDFWKQCDEKARGTSGKNRIKPSEFLTIEIHLPSFAEQQRIVAQIENVVTQIREAQGLRKQATEEARQLYMAYLNTSMQPHGAGWRQETVNNVIVSMDAGWSPQCHEISARNGEWGVLKTTAVQWCEFRPHENKALPDTLLPRPELAIKIDDVLVTRAGPRKRVGVVATVRKSEPNLTISDKLIRLRPNTQKIDARFLELSLSSPFSQEYLVQRKTGLADAQVNISQAILRKMPVAYPSLFDQRRLVAELDTLQAEVDTLKRAQAETAVELDALMPSILSKAFMGGL